MIPHFDAAEYPCTGEMLSKNREKWLQAMSWDLVRMNPGRVGIAQGGNRYSYNAAGVAAAIEVLHTVAIDHISTAGWRKNLREEIVDKVTRHAQTLAAGKISNFPRVTTTADGKVFGGKSPVLAASKTDYSGCPSRYGSLPYKAMTIRTGSWASGSTISSTRIVRNNHCPFHAGAPGCACVKWRMPCQTRSR